MTGTFDGVLDSPSPCAMPGAKLGDRSPSTAGVYGKYTGEICPAAAKAAAGAKLPHGQGTFAWDNGIIYTGTWRAGLFHGHGSFTMKFLPWRGYVGNFRDGLRHGEGAALYGGKWGYNKWVGPFVNDLAHGHGVMHMEDQGSESIAMVFEEGELAGEAPCNLEYEKALFFRRLCPTTTDATLRATLETFGPLDYCYVARNQDGSSMRIGRAKFQAVAVVADDAGLDQTQRILSARQRAVDNAAAACSGLNKSEVDGQTILVDRARPVDMKEFTRYGDY
jgi:hypothetical protein